MSGAKEMTPGELEEAKRLLAAVEENEKLRDLHTRARTGVAFRLKIPQLVADTCKARGWDVPDDLQIVMSLAVAFYMQGAPGQRLKRPDGADKFADRWPWPARNATAKAIVDSFDLNDLPKEVAGVDAGPRSDDADE